MSSIAETVRNTIAENLTGGNAVAPEKNKFSLEDVPDLSGRVAVVTGGSEGIGYGVTHAYLNKNISKIYILSPNKEVIDGAQKAIAEELGQDKAERTKWIQCDLTKWDSLPSIAKEIKDDTDRLDILVNNAARGIMTYQLTDYGVDEHMALNHLGHVVLTSHLLPLLKETSKAGHTVRIVQQASNAHQNAPKDVKFASLEELNQDLGPMALYGRSKLASILYARYLHRHLTAQNPSILSNATHPGFVETRQSAEHIHEAYPLGGYGMSVGMKPLKKDLHEGALPAIYASTVIDKSGRYICPPATDEPGSELAQSEELSEQLMKLSKDIISSKSKALNAQGGESVSFY